MEKDGAFTEDVYVKPHYEASEQKASEQKASKRKASEREHSRPQYLAKRWMTQEKGASGDKPQAFDGHCEFDPQILAVHQASSSCPTNSYLQAHANFYSRT